MGLGPQLWLHVSTHYDHVQAHCLHSIDASTFHIQQIVTNSEQWTAHGQQQAPIAEGEILELVHIP